MFGTRASAGKTWRSAVLAFLLLGCREVRVEDGSADGTFGAGTSSGDAGVASGVATGVTSASASASAGSSSSGGHGGEGGAPSTVSVGVGVGGNGLSSDIFDPNEVYLAGTLQEGSCGYGAITRWVNPQSPVTGFECYFDPASAWIANDGRLVYMNTFEATPRVFNASSGCGRIYVSLVGR